MPIYEYVCNKCGKQFEKVVMPEKGDSNIVCPGCNSSDVKRKFSMFASKMGPSASSRDSFKSLSQIQSGDACSTGTCPTCF
ncbi:MAG: zinc ribbon domain-containing protein [Candidatus Eremiobacteraeota bacterium]|nr:zinc ribbon domain-containing protein [Candidatus Eremiobacteraeota bacterium]